MIRQADTKRCFQVKDEEALNPYMGFVSFQHFNGEALYSDSIVRPENNMCETENFECYPIPDDVPQNGREEGYHPDSTVAYIRILWKEFEPEQGVYNYDFMQDILDKAKAHGQTVIFRLMAHSTRARDDVPEWLKALIPCPERPDGKRVKDSPTDPKFLQYFSEAVRKLGERFDDDPTLDAVDISQHGPWSERSNPCFNQTRYVRQICGDGFGVFGSNECSLRSAQHLARNFERRFLRKSGCLRLRACRCLSGDCGGDALCFQGIA